MTLLATAYHEAGHLIAAWAQGVAIRRVTIEPMGDAVGSVEHAPIMGRFRPDIGTSTQVRLRGERLIRVCLAGPIAQHKFNPKSWRRHHGKADHEMAADMVLYLADAGEHANAYMRLLETEARQIVDRNWEMIEALAAELMKRRIMTRPELRAFIDNWHQVRVAARTAKSGRIRVMDADEPDPPGTGDWPSRNCHRRHCISNRQPERSIFHHGNC